MDDPVDAVAIHGGGGIIGIIAAPIFMEDGEIHHPLNTLQMSPPGILMTGSDEALMRLAWNAAGAGAIIAWNFVCGIAMFALLKVDLNQVD